MALEPLRVACIGMGWWSDVLADAMQRSKKLKIVACYTRSEDKRRAFAAKYGCTAAPSYEAVLKDRSIEAIVNTTPNDVHLETTRAAAAAGKHVFLDKPIANTVSEGRAITEACRKAGVVLALGHQRRRESHFRWIREQIDAGVFGKLVNAEANISRDRLGQIDLSSWRYTAAGMPGAEVDLAKAIAADVGFGVDQLAEDARVDLLADPAEMALAAALVSQREHHARFPARLGDRPAFRYGVGDRLVEKNVLAGGGGRARRLQVDVVGRGVDDRLD